MLETFTEGCKEQEQKWGGVNKGSLLPAPNPRAYVHLPPPPKQGAMEGARKGGEEGSRLLRLGLGWFGSRAGAKVGRRGNITAVVNHLSGLLPIMTLLGV